LNRGEQDAYNEAFDEIRQELEALERIRRAVPALTKDPSVSHSPEAVLKSVRSFSKIVWARYASTSPARVVRAISEKCTQAVSLGENEKNGHNIRRNRSQAEILHRQ